jgi:DNA polymerase-3 subunit gamma/tau
MYQVLARKWRPQSLDELVGQPHVVRTLRNALTSGRLAHAYVFAGLRGTGKTTVARILAKSLNCATGPTATPCNRCVSCTEITDSRSLDVLELDAASRTGIDNIRELQEIVAYAPVRDRNKILIIDEAHMLSKAAFNALLKTLEEPPPNVIFILATTEVQKLLPTILSRCQVFEFRRLPVRELSAHLRRVATKEGIEISDRVLDGVARAGEGSVRDALSVLERVLAFCGTQVDDAEAGQVLGTVRLETLDAFIRGIAAGDAAALLTALDGVVDEGHDLVHFWGELVGVVRDLLLLRAWPGAGDVLSRAPEEIDSLTASGAGLSLEDWTRVFQVLAALEAGLKTSSQPRYLFEGALIRIASLGSLRPIEEILATLRGSSGSAEPPRAGAARTPSVPVPSAPATSPPSPQKKNVREPAPVTPIAGATAAVSPAASGMVELRATIVGAVTAARPMLGVALEGADSIRVDGASLVVAFGVGGAEMRRLLVAPDNAKTIESLVSSALGRPVALKVLGDAAREGSAAAAADTGPPHHPPALGAGGEISGSADRTPPDLADRARKDPAIRKLLDEFGAQLVDVRPVAQPVVAEITEASSEETP